VRLRKTPLPPSKPSPAQALKVLVGAGMWILIGTGLLLMGITK